jgi:ankyrin repeat protein
MSDPLISNPFLQAVASWNYAQARTLLTRGTDVNEPWAGTDATFGGATALMFALGYFDGWMLDERSPGRDFDLEFLELILRSGAKVNAQTVTGKTALHLAPATGPQRGFLLEHGANPNIGDELGMTPLHLAAKYGGTEVCEELCRHGARLEQADKYGLTPLLWAAQEAFPETASALIRLGANLQARLPDGKNVLHLAAGSVNHGRIAPTLKGLIEAGARVDADDGTGLTALHQAAHRGNADAVRLLLACGADKSTRCAGSRTAFDLARQFHHDEAASLLQI